MPTYILNGPVGQRGPGKKVCTFTGGTLQDRSMKLGPDGAHWAVLTADEVVTLTTEHVLYQHIAAMPIRHLCAQKSGWAFTVFGSSLPHAVAFLHIRPPVALVAAMGDAPNRLEFSGADLLRCYLRAADGVRSPRVWRREMPNWDEIAVNFCVDRAA